MAHTTSNKQFESTALHPLAGFSNLPDDALARLPVVQAAYACSAATVWRRVKAGLIPAPVRIGRTTAWRVGEIRKALAELRG